MSGRICFSYLLIIVSFIFHHSVVAQDKPNIILVIIDDLGWKDLGITGSDYYETPNLDQLAREGMMFTRAYATSPVCSPSRGAIFCGRSPARTGFTTVFPSTSVEDKEVWHQASKAAVMGKNSKFKEAVSLHVLPLGEITFAEALKENGYRTGYIGKWHCGWHENFSPGNQGFEYTEGYRTVPSNTQGHFGGRYIGKVKGLEGLKPDDDMADVLTDKAVDFIQKQKKQPFLLVLSHYAVHGPLEAKVDVISKYKAKKTTDQHNPVYAAMVESVDKSIGRISQALKDLNIDDNTIVIFTSDNGGYVRSTESGGLSPTSNYPLLGGKSMAYEASMRVPFIVRWPDKIQRGSVSESRTISTDIYPTLLDIAGIHSKPVQELDGISLYPEFVGSKIKERSLHFHFPHYTGYSSPYSVILEKDWKLIKFYNNDDESDGFQLFDMKADPYELKNVSKEHAETVKDLNKKMLAWQKQVGAKLPRHNEKYNSELEPTLTGADAYQTATKMRQQAEERLKED